jgi:hypothetical protein
VDTRRRECLDRLLIVGRRRLESVVHVHATDYDAHRHHRPLGQRLPLAKPPPLDEPALTNDPIPLDRVRRRYQLGGVAARIRTRRMASQRTSPVGPR